MYWTISIKSREKNLQLKSSSQQQVDLVLIYQQLPVLAWLWCNRFLLHRKLLVVVPAGCRRVVDVYPITRCSLAQVPTARLLENTVASCVKRFAAGLSGGKRVLLSPAWKIPVRSEFIFSLIPQGDAMEPRVPIVPAVKNWPRPPQPVTFIQKEITCAKAKKKRLRPHVTMRRTAMCNVRIVAAKATCFTLDFVISRMRARAYQ